ncbi:MAG TPA: DUF4350 domain-containing protein [Gillisia sp.]|nr:DUF4350 domain-containing protein [Gillisia sp.]
MRNSGKIIFGIFLLLVLFLTYLEASEPEPVNWNPSYMETDKIALGSFVFYELWEEAFDGKIEKTNVPPYEFLTGEQHGTYFFLNNYLNFDEAELEKLLNWVEEGNTLFLSSGYYSENLLDTLKLELATRVPGLDFTSMPKIALTHPDLRPGEQYVFDHETELRYFHKIDTISQTILGVANLTEFSDPADALPNFIKTEFGNGNIFLHSTPEAFSNYFLLKEENYRYTEDVMAYLDPGTTIYWDKYYKSGKSFYTSSLYILLGNKALKWAYYFLIAGAVLFIIFEGKRKQRAVPVVTPLKNQTFEYSKTIADLYVEQKKYKALAEKKIEHFYDHIRRHYRLDTTEINERFYNDLAAKSNNTEEETKDVFRFFRQILEKTEISNVELQELNQKITSFKTIKNE